MAEFKLCISDPKEGKTYQKEIKDDQASPFIGKNIGETITGDSFGAAGYELKITGGSDYCGFPMRHGILGVRKRLSIYGGIGFSGKGRNKKRRAGMKRRKTICGHKINDQISQINLVITKAGTKKLSEALGVEAKGEAKPAEAKEVPKKEAKPEVKKEAPKTEEEKPKEEAKKE